MKGIVKKMMLLPCLVLTSAMCVVAQDKESTEGKPTDIFLMIGQSNMVGVAEVGALDTITLEHVYLFNAQNEWENLKSTETEGVNRYSSVRTRSRQRLGPGYTFAKKIAAYTDREIGIVSNARGATRIERWQKGYTGEKDLDLYEEAVSRVKVALAATPGAKIKGIIWHQGEGDNSRASSVLYLQRLRQLVADLRTDLGDEKIPFIAGEVGQWKNRGRGVNPKIRSVKDSIPNTDYVTSDGLTSIDLGKNDAHFDTYSQRVLGGRYADKTYELVYKKKPEGVTLFSEAGFEGRSVLLVPGDYTTVDMEGMGLPVGEILSLKTDKGYTVQLLSESSKKEILNAKKNLSSVPDAGETSVIRVTAKKK